MNAKDEESIESLESTYCSWGDTVHYNSPTKYFADCDGSYLIDTEGRIYLDTQMAYSAVNFGYKNHFYIQRLQVQAGLLPQLASEYLTKEKVLLAAKIARSIGAITTRPGRVHFNVGGS